MKLSFFPWIRQGLANGVGGDTAGTRPKVTLTVNVRRGSAAAEPILISAEIYGPGDVLSLDRAAIIRTWPADGMEINSEQLAAVEFDRPDLPWQFSPQVPANEQLRPWIQLVVVEPGPGVTLTSKPGRNGVLKITGNDVIRAQLPDPDESWAFAHGQLAGEETSDQEELKRRLLDRPGQSSSRLLGARRLAKGKHYIGCLVPTWEAGRRAGLGMPPDDTARGFSWSLSQAEVELPVYFSWQFSCAESAGFEELVRRLKAEKNPDDATREGRIGRRTVYATKAPSLPKGFAFEAPSLFRSLTRADNRADPAAPADAGRFVKAIATLQKKKRTLTPPRYGAAYAPQGEWIDNINTDPGLRSVAALGVQIVQRHQESLVEAVWEQLKADSPGEPTVNEQVRGSLAARIVSSGQQLKSSKEVAARISWSSTVSSRRASAILSATETGTSGPVRMPPAALLPAVRRLSTIAGRSSLMARMVRTPIALPPPGISTFEDAGLPSPVSHTAAAIDAAPQSTIFQRVGATQPFPRGTADVVATIAAKSHGPFHVHLPHLPKDIPLPGTPVAWHLHQVAPAATDTAHAREFRAATRDVVMWLNGLLPPRRPFPPRWGLADLRAITSFAMGRVGGGGAVAAAITPAAPTPPAFPTGGAAEEVGIALPNNALGVRYPMWKVLHELDPQAVLAHDDEVAMNRVTLLQLVPEVHEALLAGLNHEMLREVHWRRIPVPGAPTFFDTVLNDAIPEVRSLDQWVARDNVARLWRDIPILLVRGDVIRAQPRVMVYARTYRPSGTGGAVAVGSAVPPLFSGQLDDSTRFFGFGIPVSQLVTDSFGWRFVFEEPPAEPCFIAPAAPDGPLSVSQFGVGNAAELAHGRLKGPVRASLIAKELVAGVGP